MGIWGDIGNVLGEMQSLRDDFIQEVKGDAEEIKTAVSEVSETVKDSTTDVAETLKQVTELTPTDPVPKQD